MPKPPEDTDIRNWHLYFAKENNNRAWALASRESRTPEEAADMLDAAHASALHWGVVGTELNRMRAKSLLAHVHALAGFGTSSLALAEEALAYYRSRETEDWEIASALVTHAHAAAAAGDEVKHRESWHAAKKAVEAIAGEEDRRIVQQTLDQVPKPR